MTSFSARDALTRVAGGHLCHNPNCRRPLAARYVAHPSAWFALPRSIRAGIWSHYRSGQEIDKRPTRTYLDALEAAITWWREHQTKCEVSDA